MPLNMDGEAPSPHIRDKTAFCFGHNVKTVNTRKQCCIHRWDHTINKLQNILLSRLFHAAITSHVTNSLFTAMVQREGFSKRLL